MYDLAIKEGEVFRHGHWQQLNIYVSEGVIARLTEEELPSREIYSANGLKVLPGLIDPHVHFALNLGRLTSADDFYSGSVSAAYGGVTTYIDFLDPVSKAGELQQALESRLVLARESVVDYSFHATLKNPAGEVDAIVEELMRLNLNRVKIFTTYSDSGRRTYDREVLELLKHSADGALMVLAHIEADDQIIMDESFTYRDLNRSRPSESEVSEALKLAAFTRETGGKLYMVHLSSGQTLKRFKES